VKYRFSGSPAARGPPDITEIWPFARRWAGYTHDGRIAQLRLRKSIGRNHSGNCGFAFVTIGMPATGHSNRPARPDLREIVARVSPGGFVRHSIVTKCEPQLPDDPPMPLSADEAGQFDRHGVSRPAPGGTARFRCIVSVDPRRRLGKSIFHAGLRRRRERQKNKIASGGHGAGSFPFQLSTRQCADNQRHVLRCRATISPSFTVSRKNSEHARRGFLQYLRHERGQSDNTAKTYAALLGKFTRLGGNAKSLRTGNRSG